MKALFTFLFWLIGYRYEEGEVVRIKGKEYYFYGYGHPSKEPDTIYRPLYAYKKEWLRENGHQLDLLLGQYSQPFKERWHWFNMIRKIKNKKQ